MYDRVLLSLALLASTASLVIAGPLPDATADPTTAVNAKAEAPSGVATGEGIPAVRFDYGFVPFDRACSALGKTEIPKEQIAELEERLASFQALWDREGPRFLAATVAATGKPFRQNEQVAVMSLCNFPSMSHPLLINMRRFMESGPEQPPRPLFMFPALVFHELLHIYITDQLESSALAEKYVDEPGSVKSHIHLLAVMKMVYLQLGLEKELAQIIAKDQKPGREIYTRAWEIVNELEGYQPFVDELKN